MDLLQELKGHIGTTWTVKWSPDGKTLASCGEDKTIRLWCLENEDPLRFGLKTILTDCHERAIRSVCWSPCGKYLASASFDTTVAIWDRNSGEFECNVTLEGHESEVKSVSWCNSGDLLATSSRDKSVWIWSKSLEVEHEYECAAVLSAHTQDVKRVAWHPTRNLLASASYDNTVRLYTEDSEEEWCSVALLKGHESTVWGLAFDATGDRLATCSDDCTVRIWRRRPDNNWCAGDEETWTPVCTLSGYTDRTIYDVSWCHRTGLLAAAGGDDHVRLFADSVSTPDQLSLRATVHAHKQDVNCVDWCPAHDGVLATCGDDGAVKLWMVQPVVTCE